MIRRWEAYENALLFHLDSFFLILNGLRVILKMVQVLPSSYFRANVLTVRPNTANDMALESLKKYETFWYVFFLPILYSFKSVLKMAKNIFLP